MNETVSASPRLGLQGAVTQGLGRPVSGLSRAPLARVLASPAPVLRSVWPSARPLLSVRPPSKAVLSDLPLK